MSGLLRCSILPLAGLISLEEMFLCRPSSLSPASVVRSPLSVSFLIFIIKSVIVLTCRIRLWLVALSSGVSAALFVSEPSFLLPEVGERIVGARVLGLVRPWRWFPRSRTAFVSIPVSRGLLGCRFRLVLWLRLVRLTGILLSLLISVTVLLLPIS